MRVPLGWLKEFVDVEAEPARLAEDLTAAGLAVDAIEAVGAETVFELDITTNRVDCMNVHGVAREVAALYGLPLREIDTTVTESGPPAADVLDVEIEAPDLCGRFCAGVLDVRVGPSPAWLRDRLEQVGIRSINNVVDLTNYVMIETGQPSHSFDLARVPGAQLVVRWSREGETVTTLDGIERKLPARVGVIAGRRGEPALALAGVMGGASSEIGDDTRVVALEAAWWEPLAVRRGARAMSLHTEASHRFERGADIGAGPRAIARLAHLLQKIGGGGIRPGLVERTGHGRAARRVRLRPERVDALLGVAVPAGRQAAILRSLGFAVEENGREAIVDVPSWRLDVSREADLAEEVGRHFGVDRVPPAIPPSTRPGRLRPSQKRERRIREILTGIGLTEVINYAFVAGGQVDAPSEGRVRLANPLTEEQDTLRTSLVMPGLLGTLRTNLRLGRRDAALFELGRVFLPDGAAAPREEARLGLLLAGQTQPHHWSAKARPFDLFDMKGIADMLFIRLGLTGVETGGRGALPAFVHPGRAFALTRRGQPIGWAGALHPDARAAWELRDEVVVLELATAALLDEAPAARFTALDRFPAVERDLSILCDESVPAAEIDARVRAAAGERLRTVSLVDRYTGNQVPPGKVSLTVSLRFQDAERTLTSDEVQEAVDRVVAQLRAAGCEIRA